MIFQTGNRRDNGDDRLRGAAFTLIELILVMAMLMVVIGVAFPSLKGFFRGRHLDSEALRFLSLTRFGQSRAVSEGVPMSLWIDTRQGTYGLQAQTGYTDSDSNAVSFTVNDDLRVEVEASPVVTSSILSTRSAQTPGNLPAIHFSPDGFIGENSAAGVVFRQDDGAAIWVAENENRLKYEIQTNLPPNLRR